MRVDVDFNKAPLLVIWEITRACALACRHCRASAEDRRDPRELSLDEGRRLIDDVARMGTPLIIFTGGDPLQRDDLEDFIRHAKSRQLRAGAIPATTDRLTKQRLASLKEAGVDQIAISIDGATAAQHDDFRQVPGSFAKAMAGAAWARELGIPLQVNSVLGGWNVNDFDALAALVERLGIVFWEVFFLVPTGRGAGLQGCTADQFEMLFEKLHRLAERASFIVKITEGQHYRRYAAQQANGSMRVRIGLSREPVNAGRGFCFVDHIGNICPSGFLPIICGNVRESSLIDVYQTSPLFLQLRDTSLLKGKCGRCGFRELCSGGSRARAFAATGDHLESDPCCAYEPTHAYA